MRFVFYINSANGVYEYFLPAVNDRQVKLPLTGFRDDIALSLEVYDNVWSINGSGSELYINRTKIGMHTLSDGDIIHAFPDTRDVFAVMVFEVTSALTGFFKYDISGNNSIKIGKSEENDIVINDSFISQEHAELIRSGADWRLYDRSTNGVYINARRVTDGYVLKPFDVIYTIGFKIIFLKDVIAINRRDIVSCSLDPFDGSKRNISYTACTGIDFSRSPRSIEPLCTDEIQLEAPPAPQRNRSQPLLFVVGPSVTMPIPILLSVIVSMNMGASSTMFARSIVSVAASAVIALSWALAHRRYDKKMLKQDEEFRVDAYKDYIRKNIELIKQKQSINESILLTQYLSSDNIIQKLISDNRFIWNRNSRHDDFLSVRTGIGTVKFQAPITVPQQRFSLYKDNLTELPHNVAEKYEYLKNSVTLLDILNNPIIGFVGEKTVCDEVLSSIIVQISALHSYTDVRIAVFFGQGEEKSYSWTRFLPHTFCDDMKSRMVANDNASYSNVLYYLNSELRKRTEEQDSAHNERFSPHYVIICTSPDIFDGDPIERYFGTDGKYGTTFILRYGKIEHLPNECHEIVECTDYFTGVYDLEKSRSDLDRIDLDKVSAERADSFARILSRLRVKELSTGEIPSSIDYFDMIGIGRLEQWNLIKRYKENRVYEGIRSFVGIGSGGKPMYIDIHEKKYGPHGLVAGTTGSGKSETLQTFILSLALNYHPDEVAFILIDYKGGGMANVFLGMPHVAGTITNLGGGDNDSGELDTNLTRRALVSIKSEIKRRQTIFNTYNVNHIDNYIRLYRDKKANDPLPHLIIISDEFAELKKEQPEFIKELVSTARVGRSLGIHLILATQKPGGVVDDEIWSNSRFKLCLRVQDKQDSMGMLKRPEAAFLTNTGRAYLQIGNDEIFEQFQTGYSGAPYNPKESVNDAADSDISMITIDGQPAVERKKEAGDKNAPTELKAAVEYIAKVCAENSISAVRPLWLGVLGTDITHDSIEQKYNIERKGISAVYGIVDYPEKQTQFPAVIDISACSNLMIVSLSGMGKTTLLQTIMYSLASKYTPDQVNFYIFDFSGRTLKSFNLLPHTGLVAFPEEDEAVRRCLGMIRSITEERKKLFNEANVGSYSEYVKYNTCPLIILFVDNYYSFAENYENLSDDFSNITRDCPKYGIQVIITCSHMSDVRIRLKQNFANMITGVLGDKSEYREAWGISPEFLPDNKKGRGLTGTDGRLVEFQTALPVEGEDESQRNSTLRSRFAEIAAGYSRSGARKVAVIPMEQTSEEFISSYSDSADLVPIGYFKSDISICYINLKTAFCYAVSEAGYKGQSLIFSGIYRFADKHGIKTYTIKLKNEMKIRSSLYGTAASDKESIRTMLTEIRGLFVERAAAKRGFLAEHPDDDFTQYILGKFDKVFVMIDSMSELMQTIDSDDCADLKKFLTTAFQKSYGMGIYFIAGFDTAAYSTSLFIDPARSFAARKEGIHLGGCYDKQKLFDVNLPLSKMSKQQEYFIGYTQINGEGAGVFIPNK